ncbi:TetR/AcrR family transcriptional regulator [Cellulosimicrobium sp. Marseille-Q4280]|uniref:TetR/AcrR family transcriptional regulator n=1 Tax=Cellulosimicrobium sp. Marseille-Q4280 TaxID=2937992 RepID=UPI00203AAC13|nr:TetR/AcrR family transcriptional regulator [Cellulosimicrobium sp. Marseille-Q4280]
MPRVTEEYRAARRDEIVDAALRVFRRKGFQAASMADIIAESGLSAGAIYGYFASKSEIVRATATRIVGARVLDVERLAAQEPLPAPAQVVRVLMTGVQRELGDPGILVQLWGEAMTDPALRGLAAGVVGRIRTTFEHYLTEWHQRANGLAGAAATALAVEQAPLFVGVCQGCILQSGLFEDFDRDGYLDQLDRYLPR